MNVKCLIGAHTWDGCKCSKCHKIRDEQHDWTKDCEQCSKCGRTRSNAHKFKNRFCTICGLETREGTVTDPRDGITYKTIRIGNQTIMAENLRYKTKQGHYWAYYKEKDTEKYGYLYDWETACKITNGLEGWHLPTKEEWETLMKYLDPYYGVLINSKQVYFSVIEGGSSGFNALFGGCRTSHEVSFLGTMAHFWSSTSNIGASSNKAWYFVCFSAPHEEAFIFDESKDLGYSVRLFRDH
jgi:uncharacterized protein (TIGR02145 family)